jgi:hypothetical protein
VSDRTNNDLAALLTPAPSRGVQFSQGKILTWERGGELRNTIEWRGITLTDVPIVEGVNALALKPGDIVGMLGWAPENAKGVGTWWILGKLSAPGEFVSDLTFFLGQVRYMTKQNPDVAQVYIGWNADTGTPLTIFYYGDSAETRALQIANENNILIRDPSGNAIFENDAGTGVGLAQPYFNIPMYPSTGTSVVVGGPFWPSFTNVAYQEVMHGITTLWHPRIRMGVAVSITAGSLEWQLRVDGTVIGSATGAGNVTGDVPGWGTTTLPGDQRSVQLWCRNTSGTASRVITDYCYGLQS